VHYLLVERISASVIRQLRACSADSFLPFGGGTVTVRSLNKIKKSNPQTRKIVPSNSIKGFVR